MLDDLVDDSKEIPLEERIHQEGGIWYMRIDKKCKGVALPPEIGRLVHGAIQAQTRVGKDGYEWVKEVLEKINCHKTVLYALGLLKTSDRAKPTYGFPLFDEKEYVEFAPQNANGIATHLKKCLRGELGVVQLSTNGGVFAAHTFLAGVDQLGRVVCFEKGGYSFPFRITLLDGVWRNKGLSSFAAAPLTEFQKYAPRAQMIRKVVEEKSRG